MPTPLSPSGPVADRRQFLAYFSSIGLGSSLLPGVLWGKLAMSLGLPHALLLLKPQPRQLVALAFFNGLSHEEIASQTCLPLGTVKSQIRRALITLRDALGDNGAHALPA